MTNIPRKTIEALRIYPPLGIARVGNAVGEEDYVIGPEVIGGSSTLPNGKAARYLTDFRAADGRIKRQAARFRIFAHLKDGTAVELTADQGVRVEWRVAIANLKAGWYEFNQAMDLPRGLSKNARRRNENLGIPGSRGMLDIVPTPKRIKGLNISGAHYAFDDGRFWNKPVYLGELRTDDAGRLLFLGGRGLSSAFRDGLNPLTFANNLGWHDDVCDGAVRATVTLPDGTKVEAEPAYVAVTPPNYAPGLFGLITLDDAVRETFHSQGWLGAPTSTSFTDHIWPIFDRLTGLQWVNHGLFVLHGHGSPIDAREPSVLDRLQDASAANEQWRRAVLALFRNPGLMPLDEAKLPTIYGDGYGESDTDSLARLSVTRTQYSHLESWAAGGFKSDWPGHVPVPPDFGKLSPSDQVLHLERASLHECLGGPFHPGIELTWVMRLPRLWKSAYRLNVLAGDQPARQDYGDTLTPEVCVGPGGPFDGVAAGALTRFLGVPWQTDGASCNSAADYEPTTFLSMPTFWGARVPDQVLAVANYERAATLDPKRFMTQAQKHFMLRVDWLRDVRDLSYYRRIANMVENWWELGMVLPLPDPPAHLPADIRVEQGRNPENPGSDPKRALVAAVESLGTDKAAAVLAGMAALPQPSAYIPPKRRFRQGEI